MMKNRITSAICAGILFLGLVSISEAAVISADDAFFGPGTLTRDTAQMLDFLDVTESTFRSFTDVSGHFGVGGDFEGFRHATEDEVLMLINNFGFSPGAVAGDTIGGDTNTDQLSGLVSLLGVTADFSPVQLVTSGLTSTITTGTARRLIVIADIIQPVAPNDTVNAMTAFGPDAVMPEGHFLVRTAPIPTPSAMLLMGTGLLGLIGWNYRRTKKS